MPSDLKYASFELFPCVYTPTRGWVWFEDDRGWIELHPAEIAVTARMMTKAQFDSLFPQLPPFPKAALQADE